MEEIVNLIAADEAASDISDKIKDILFAKSAEKVDSFRPEVAANTFGDTEAQDTIDQAAAEISGEAAAERAGEEPAPSI